MNEKETRYFSQGLVSCVSCYSEHGFLSLQYEFYEFTLKQHGSMHNNQFSSIAVLVHFKNNNKSTRNLEYSSGKLKKSVFARSNNLTKLMTSDSFFFQTNCKTGDCDKKRRVKILVDTEMGPRMEIIIAGSR